MYQLVDLSSLVRDDFVSVTWMRSDALTNPAVDQNVSLALALHRFAIALALPRGLERHAHAH